MTQPAIPSSDSLHAVRFYQDSDSLRRMIATFLHKGIAEGLPALVVATEMHRVGVATELTKLGLDVPELRREGRLLLQPPHARRVGRRRDRPAGLMRKFASSGA